MTCKHTVKRNILACIPYWWGAGEDLNYEGREGVGMLGYEWAETGAESQRWGRGQRQVVRDKGWGVGNNLHCAFCVLKKCVCSSFIRESLSTAMI